MAESSIPVGHAQTSCSPLKVKGQSVTGFKVSWSALRFSFLPPFKFVIPSHIFIDNRVDWILVIGCYWLHLCFQKAKHSIYIQIMLHCLLIYGWNPVSVARVSFMRIKSKTKQLQFKQNAVYFQWSKLYVAYILVLWQFCTNWMWPIKYSRLKL